LPNWGAGCTNRNSAHPLSDVTADLLDVGFRQVGKQWQRDPTPCERTTSLDLATTQRLEVLEFGDNGNEGWIEIPASLNFPTTRLRAPSSGPITAIRI
jgi:hypothetical protein